MISCIVTAQVLLLDRVLEHKAGFIEYKGALWMIC